MDSDEQSVVNTGGSVWTVTSSQLRIQGVLYGQRRAVSCEYRRFCMDSDEQSVVNTGGSVWTVTSSQLRI
jgi:hypothetical protein